MKSSKAPRLPASSLEEFEQRVVTPRAGRTLIVGSQVYGDKEDRRARYPDVVGIDMLAGPGVDRVLDLEESLPDDLGLFDHVECMSVLEHSRRPWLLAANIERLMAPGATLFVSVPFVWRIHGYPNDYWRLTPEGVRALFPEIEWTAVMLASHGLTEGPKFGSTKVGAHPYFARTETVAFGTRKPYTPTRAARPRRTSRQVDDEHRAAFGGGDAGGADA
ncbi:class I SAM-dependent methyltransferase [Dokdonella sp. MW10]|uniref:class I SAM-dependent methyltransferase n=1 Tax=Dokdonella sp. MW10 TaxID=2992926 RepID=UPI003F7DFBD9